MLASEHQLMKKNHSIRIFSFDFKDSPRTVRRTKTVQRDLDRQSPILIRRHRAAIENFPSHQPSADIDHFSGSQLQISQAILRSKSPRLIKSSKIPKYSHSFQSTTFSDISRPLKGQSLSIKPRYQIQRSKCESLFSPRILNRNIEFIKKANTTEVDEIKSNVAVSSDEDEDSTVANCDTPIYQFESPTFIPNRRSYHNFHLPPVFEEIFDEK